METTRPQRPPFSSIAVSERPEKRIKIRHFILVTLTQQCSTKLRSFKGFKSSCLFKKVGEANANCSRNLSSAEICGKATTIIILQIYKPSSSFIKKVFFIRIKLNWYDIHLYFFIFSLESQHIILWTVKNILHRVFKIGLSLTIVSLLLLIATFVRVK